MRERKKTPWPWIVATAALLPVLYFLSFGPACWYCDRSVRFRSHYFFNIYCPLVRLADAMPGDATHDLLCGYASLFGTSSKSEAHAAFVNDRILRLINATENKH